MPRLPLVHRLRLLAISGVTIVSCVDASAQTAVPQFSLTAGSATDARGLRSNAVTASPGVVFFPASPLTVALSATGSHFAGNDWQAGGDAGLSGRSGEWAHGTLTVNALGSYAQTSYHANFAVAEATPALELRLGTLTAFGGARIASGRTTVRGAPLSGTPVVLSSVTRSSQGPVYGAQWRVAGGDVPLLIAYREERARTAGELVLDRTASAALTLGRLSLGGSAGRRTSLSETMSVSSGSVALALTPSLSLQAGAGRYPSSRLTGTAAGRYVSLGLFLHGGGLRTPRLPRPAGAPPLSPSMTRLSIRASSATRVELAGDWNDWTPVAARRADNGVWYVDVPLAPGEYRYAFRVDGGAWRVPEGAVVADDGFGGKSAFITVATVVAARPSHNQEER